MTPPRPALQSGRATRRKALVRRRIAAAGALLAVVVVAAVALLGGHSSTHPTHAVNHGGAGHRRFVSTTHHLTTLAQREDAAINRLIDRQGFITAGGRERREIALTFDDGPGPYTFQLLDAVRRMHVPATFFEIGFMIHYFNDALEDELRIPNVVIGDHTETHPMMALLSAAKQQSEILTQTEQLAKYGAPFPDLYRPPYGSLNETTMRILRQYHMLMVLWTVDTSDYTRPGVASIVKAALSGARPGAIILMHDGGGNRTQTIEALPRIVRALRARGYRLVTIPQLVLDDPPTTGQTLPLHLANG